MEMTGPVEPARHTDHWRQVLVSVAEQDVVLVRLRRALGLSRTEFHALLTLWHSGPMAMSALAERIDHSGSAMTALTDRMEQAGLIARAPDTTDRRRTLLHVTWRFERLVRFSWNESAQQG